MLAEHDGKLLKAIVGVRPADGEDAVRFVVVVCGYEWLLIKAANLWQVVVVCVCLRDLRLWGVSC